MNFDLFYYSILLYVFTEVHKLPSFLRTISKLMYVTVLTDSST